jgi:3-deoxy-7-phosphoheptulonate synthase
MNKSSKIVSVKFGENRVIRFGGPEFVLIAGPCAIENKEQFLSAALHAKQSGASLLRGGIHKMRTNPTSFQGVGHDAFHFIREVKTAVGLPLVSEITDPRQLGDFLDVVDMLQVGSRNMYNYSLLKELGQVRTPVLLKRGFSATVEEWLLAAEYIRKGGNENVILCERGIRTFETTTRNTLDLNSVAYVKAHTDLPVVVDPSHGTGRRELIKPLALAATALGADGLMIEIHPDPDKSLSDAFQALDFERFDDIAKSVERILGAVGRTLQTVAPNI